MIKVIFHLILYVNILSLLSNCTVIDKYDANSMIWISAFNKIGNEFNKISQIIIPEFSNIVSEINISSECEQRLRELITGHDNQQWIAKSMHQF